MNRHFRYLVCALPLFAVTVVSAIAHDMWIAPASFVVGRGDIAALTFPSAHVFPASDGVYVDKKTMVDTRLISPSGKSGSLTGWEGDVLRTGKLEEEGTYLVLSGNRGGFYTKTTDGTSERKPKNEVRNAATGTFSKKFTKALLTVGKGGGAAFAGVAGHELEIIPLENPSLLRAGDRLSVRVLLNGKPYKTEINATYDSFSLEKNVFAYTVKTDEDGIAKIKLMKKGAWLLKAVNKVPYADPKKADTQSYTATLTFAVE